MGRKLESFHGSKTQTVVAGSIPDTPLETIDRYLNELKEHQLEWAQAYPLEKRIELLKRVLERIEYYKDDWAALDMQARHIPEGHFSEPESYVINLALAGHVTRVYIHALEQLLKNGGYIPVKAREEGDRVVVDAFPLISKDSLFLPGVKAEVHLEAGTRLADLPELIAAVYRDKHFKGGVSLVLGAGNIGALALNDVFHKLFGEKRVVLLKAHPVLEYMGPLMEKVLAPFIEEGFVRIVNGGSREGAHLVTHPLVDDIHITGSDKTFEGIVYGFGDEGLKNKLKDHRINARPVTGELGNVTPVIVVPGDWKDSDYDYQAENIFSMLAFYNGYTCQTARVIILPKYWAGSKILMDKIREKMEKAPPAVKYYPGTDATIQDAISCYPRLTKYGTLDEEHQPWMLAPDLESDKDEYAFNREFWASFIAQTYLDGGTTEEYLANAVKFANDKLWGTLAATLIIDSKTEKELRKSGSLQKAIDDLHYGTVALNITPGFGTAIGSTPWGGYPGATYDNIQSGNGFVSNALMLDKIEKTVITAPFRVSPKPIWFISDKPNLKAGIALTDFAISNKFRDFGRLIWAIMRN